LPKVTIGLPTFNRAPTLKRSIELILNQTFIDFELLIYDDGSSDNTVDSVKSFADKRISYFSFPNQGPPIPLNFILGKAKGEYIIFLHDHDHFRKDLIQQCVDSLDGNPEVGFVLPAGITISENEDMVENPKSPPHGFDMINDGNLFLQKTFLQVNSFQSKFHACSMVRMTAMHQVGNKYHEKYGFYSDVELWLRLLYNFNFIYIDEVLIQFTVREADHKINGNEVKIFNSLYEIHIDKIHEFFPQKIKKLHKILKNKYFSEIFWLLAYQTANKVSGVDGQIKKISKNYLGSRLKFMLLKVFRSSLVKNFLPILKKLILRIPKKNVKTT